MSAFLVQPLAFTVGANSGWASITPVSFANLDHPGLVARSTGNTASFTVNLGSAQTIDTIALIGSNLPASATVTITATGLNTGALPAYTGFKDPTQTTKTIVQFSPVTVSAVTVSISSNAPIEFQRLILGKRVETVGIDQSPERLLEDQSVVESGPGWTTVDKYPVLSGWKVDMSWISDQKWNEEIWPLVSRVGSSDPVLFVPVNDPARFQNEAVFGRLNGIAKGKVVTSDKWTLSFTITGLAR